MKFWKVSISLLCVGVLAILALNSHQYTKESMEASRLSEKYHIYPVPIPADLSFAGEKVPLNEFNVKERLDRELLVNTYWQSNTMLILKRSRKFFDVIEPILKENGIPDDFKYLAVAESALQQAVSPAGAKGIWQFIERSGKYYGLTINDDIDERYHLKRSTEAACRYLKEAYKEFGSWTLAAASYNRGISGLRSAMENQKVDDFYKLHLNSETSRYVMRILAFKTIFEKPVNYGFHITESDYYHSIPTIGVTVEGGIADLADFAKEHKTEYGVVRELNPWILGSSLKGLESKYEILVPAESK